MNEKKILTALAICAFALHTNFAFSDPIVELAAPRMQAPKIIQDDGTATSPATTDQKKSGTLSEKKNLKRKSLKKVKKQIRKKLVPIKVDYDKVSKLIEYGYYDYADKILSGAIGRNSKDIQALSLNTISLAKQLKLDPAQSELDDLLKKYPNNSNLHYAQGIVDYQRTASSNMDYRLKSEKLKNDALTEFKKAIELDKNNARAYNAAGVISLNAGKVKDAESYFKKAVDVDKTYSPAIDNLGTLDLLNNKLDDAEQKFKSSLSYNTQNTTSMYHLAQVAMQKQDYSRALMYLNNALYINPNSPAIYNLMGKAYQAQGNEAAAINSFKKSIQVKPEFALSYSDLADIYEKRGDSNFAIEQLKTVLNVDPSYNDAKLKIADISLSDGNFKQAISYYSELVGIDGYNEAALKGLASGYFLQAQSVSAKANLASNKDFYNALDSINKAISANPQDFELHLAKLKLAKLTNQPELSKVELNQIIQSPSCDLMSFILKGEAYVAMNDYQKAQEMFDSAAKLSTGKSDDLYLAEIYIYHKQYNSADAVLQKVLKVDLQNQEALNDIDYIQKAKKYAENYFKSATKFLKTNNTTTAAEYLSRSLALDPSNEQAHLLLAQIDEKQKNIPAAVSHYKAYLSLCPNVSDAKKIEKKIKYLEDRI